MGLRRLLTSVMLAFVLLPGGAACEPAFVLVNPSPDYATVYVSVPLELPADAREALGVFIMENEGAYLEPWSSFLRDLGRHVTAHIRRNDYPEVDATEAIVLLLRELELQEIALTWNGGVAMGDDDYEFAELTYEAYTRDHGFVARPRSRGRDPVHPWNHTGPLLNARPGTGQPS